MDPDPLPLYAAFFNLGQLTNGILLVLLLICSALISASEVALFSLTPSEINAGEEQASKKQKIIVRLLAKPKKLLATILIANNAINIAIVLLFESVTSIWFNEPWIWDLTIFTLDMEFALKVVVATFLILLFGEILPKIYASRNKISFSQFMAYPLLILDKSFWLFNVPMQRTTLSIHKRLGRQKSSISVDQLSHALELTLDKDTTVADKKILEGIVSFGNTDTKQVMTPRMDVFALNKEGDFKSIISDIVKHGFSRIPVFEGSIDKVIGILYVKDLLPYINHKTFDWVSLVREPYFVPENKKLDDLLSDFKNKKSHLAIVVDEYGGTSGLISLEDIIEEIVGDISGEFDDEDIVYSKIDDKNYVFEGRTALKDFYKVVKLEDPAVFENQKGDAETIAGFLLEIKGNFPVKGEIIRVDGYSFTIEVLSNKRIKQIKFTIEDES
ncbi:gliding motility-associated protein GldE [Aquimarina rhabdastrellae]